MNLCQLEGTVLERQVLRYTPGGVGITEFVVEHVSNQTEGGLVGVAGAGPRQISLSMHVRAAGTLAQLAQDFEPGQGVRVEGFLAPKRKDSKQLVLIAQKLQRIEARVDDDSETAAGGTV